MKIVHNILYKYRWLSNTIAVVFFVLVVPSIVGCSAKYGKLQRDSEVQLAFETNQAPTTYRYYYYGYKSEPYVVFGIDPKFEMDSRVWREVGPDTEEFKEMIRWIWEDYGYNRFGANILDPYGSKVGVYYSSIRETAFKFKADNQIVVIPHTPFLWGPEDGGGTYTP
ncbi:MAG: hypothetical protein PVG44_04040 [Desulfobacterales bacterium]|jgi:hypothetical protein